MLLRTRSIGLLLAGLIATAVVAGAALLISLDFAGAEGLTHAWSALSAPSAEELLERRLKGFMDIDLFAAVEVPGSNLKVETGTSFANARALADGRATRRWCYVQPIALNSAVSLKVELGKQTGTATPVLIEPSQVSADQAKQLDLTPEALVDMARRDCRFPA